ncbi:DUF397 domain-containing protein [Streptomyces avicenniae]|uniref:DUF397 domain-containing protein n=1 Tax=Streptomyces avicenniae TaxID=500153 RepID=UPI000DA605B4|nr:DUF397 domain-containing protein [Streptomyces avicenniae]
MTTPCTSTPPPAVWRRSTFSDGSGGNCVEIAVLPGVEAVAVRDSKTPDRPHLRFSRQQFAVLITALAGD